MTKTTEKPICYRQGDVLTVVRPLPTNLTPLEPDNDRVVLAHGEVTGHAHAFYGGAVKRYRHDDVGGAVYVDLGAGDDLKHEEHSTIHHPPLPAGLGMLVAVQVEYTPQALRNVAD